VQALDDPARIDELRRRIRRKRALESWYRECYAKYAECVARCPREGAILELGSGGGFLKEVMPEAVTSDVLPYAGVDRVVDASRLDFADGALRAILLLNVLHHLADVEAFFREAERCLAPGGRVLLVDQYLGWISTPILRYLHHEPCDPGAERWAFESSGPLSGGNGALAWIVFQRDRALFERRFPRLRIATFRPHSPLRYFLAGGLKDWSLLPGAAFPLASRLDAGLAQLSHRLCSFLDVELVRA
jgi:SAM-dependent methyltransferase